MPVHQITYDSARSLIYEFLKQVTDAGETIGLGGTIAREDLYAQASTRVPGTIGWYCFNFEDRISSLPSFFMAFETNAVDYEPTPSSCINEVLYFSGSAFTYNGEVSPQGVDYFLQSQEQIPGTTSDISDDDVELCMDYFLGNYPAGERNPYAESCCAFFNADELNEFLNQSENYPYVRYLLGFDDSHPNQKIRLILMPVDANGYNVTSNVIMLQHSWPPYST